MTCTHFAHAQIRNRFAPYAHAYIGRAHVRKRSLERVARRSIATHDPQQWRFEVGTPAPDEHFGSEARLHGYPTKTRRR